MFLRSLLAGVLALAFVAKAPLSAQPVAPVVPDSFFDQFRHRHHDDDHTFVGPTLRGVVAAPAFCYGAYSFLFEIAPRNFRFDVTLGYQVCDNHYFKVSADILTQKLRYRDIKKKHLWVHQESYGIGYAYDWNCGILSTLDADVYWTNAHDKDFSNLQHSFLYIDADLFPDGTNITQTYKRNLAGAHAWGLSFGFTLEPLQCATLSLAANYDHVDYHTKFRPLEQKNGWGGTALLHYQLFDCVGIDFRGAWRRPYNDYQAAINWYFEGCTPCDRAAFGIFGGYTNGKYGVPNVGNAGIQLAYWFGGNSNGCYDYNCCEPQYDACDPCCEPASCFDIVAWTSRPAVYQPVVLNTRDTAEYFTYVQPVVE